MYNQYFYETWDELNASWLTQDVAQQEVATIEDSIEDSIIAAEKPKQLTFEAVTELLNRIQQNDDAFSLEDFATWLQIKQKIQRLPFKATKDWCYQLQLSYNAYLQEQAIVKHADKVQDLIKQTLQAYLKTKPGIKDVSVRCQSLTYVSKEQQSQLITHMQKQLKWTKADFYARCTVQFDQVVHKIILELDAKIGTADSPKTWQQALAAAHGAGGVLFCAKAPTKQRDLRVILDKAVIDEQLKLPEAIRENGYFLLADQGKGKKQLKRVVQLDGLSLKKIYGTHRVPPERLIHKLATELLSNSKSKEEIITQIIMPILQQVISGALPRVTEETAQEG